MDKFKKGRDEEPDKDNGFYDNTVDAPRPVPPPQNPKTQREIEAEIARMPIHADDAALLSDISFNMEHIWLNIRSMAKDGRKMIVHMGGLPLTAVQTLLSKGYSVREGKDMLGARCYFIEW